MTPEQILLKNDDVTQQKYKRIKDKIIRDKIESGRDRSLTTPPPTVSFNDLTILTDTKTPSFIIKKDSNKLSSFFTY